MLTLTTLALGAVTLASAIPAPQTTSSCGTTLTAPDKFQLAAVPIYANYSLIALSTTGGGSGLVIIPTSDDMFTNAANFTYNLAQQRLSTVGETNATDAPTYTSLNPEDSLEISFSTAPPADGSGLLQLADDGECDDVSYFVKGDEADVGLYGWTLCNNGALGWVGTSTAEPCEKVALRAYVNASAPETQMRLVSAARAQGKTELKA